MLNNLKDPEMFKRHDIIIYLIVLLLAGAAYLIYSGTHRSSGSMVRVSIDGEFFADYPLSADLENEIRGAYDGHLKLVIRNGCACVENSTCRDHICVKHSAISHEGESIICLPNRIVVEIISDDITPGIDAIS